MLDFKGCTLDQVCDRLRPHGLFLYREYFRWGRMPAFQSADKSANFFLDRGELLNARELLDRLRAEWRPPFHSDDWWYFAGGSLEHELKQIPCAPLPEALR